MLPTYHLKLVRDKIDQILSDCNVDFDARIMTVKEHQQALLHKLIEEAKEVRDASTKEQRIEELGDLLEVFIELLEAHEIEFPDVDAVRFAKKEERGGFSRRLYLIWTRE
jgi:predicted house-cleaning noncanonical NTP pyrophosphatase (MazG superfamily)